MSIAFELRPANLITPSTGAAVAFEFVGPSTHQASCADAPTPSQIWAARCRAQTVLDAIKTVAWPNDEVGITSVHQPFARVYYQTTRHWLQHLDTHPEAWLGCSVIDHFFHRYRVNVIALDDERPVPHWRPYFAIASAYERNRAPHLLWPLLWAGFWAHIRWDLTDAIVSTHREHVKWRRVEPCRTAFHRMMLESQTDELFYRAALDYLASERTRSSEATTPHHEGATRWARRLRTIWVPTVQRWRSSAWAQACALIDDGHDAGRSVRASLG